MEKATSSSTGTQPAPILNIRPVKTDLGEVLGGTWDMYKKNFKLFSIIFIIPTLIITAIEAFIQPAVTTSLLGEINETAGEQFLKFQGPIVTALIFVISFATLVAIINFITYGAMLRACGESEKGGASVGKAYAFSWARFWQGVALSIRIFFYSLAWIGLIILVLIFGAMIIASISGISVKDFTQFTALFGLLGLLAPIILIALAIIVIIRSLKASFAFAIFYNDEKVSPKEALDKSIKLSEGITGKIFLNYFLLGILFAVIGGIYGAIASPIVLNLMPSQSAFSSSLLSIQQLESQLDQIMAVVTIPLMVVAGTMGIIFQYVFAKKAAEEKGL